MSLAQVNRASEDRQDHKPRLADLRESGCVTGDTLVPLADTGSRLPIRDLVGKSGFRVWAIHEPTLTIQPATVASAFPTGRKPVYRLETRLGRVIRATANHQFRTLQEWRRLDELVIGDRIALPRRVPCQIQGTVTQAEAALMGHLIGDGCTLPRHAIQYTTRELDLAETVADLSQEVFGSRVRPRIQRELQWYQVYLSSSVHLTHGCRNPVAEWLDRWGIFGLRSYQKRAPDILFQQPSDTISAFLRHLWSTDGCVQPPKGGRRHPSIYYASSSERLARDVQSLLLRLGINAILKSHDQKGKGRTQFHVLVMGQEDILRFAEQVGAAGSYKSSALVACREWLAGRKANTNRDVIPRRVWREIAVPAMQRNGVTLRRMQNGLGMRCMGTTLYKQNVSRERMARLAKAVGGDEFLTTLARSDVYWDEIVSITPAGEEDVYDLTVPGPANFIAEDVVVHNSIEQDADTVMLMHRPEMYEPGQHPGVTEVLIAKQRNGPTGEITLTFLKQFMRFENFAIEQPFGLDS
jgi:replicative DNA helicase